MRGIPPDECELIHFSDGDLLLRSSLAFIRGAGVRGERRRPARAHSAENVLLVARVFRGWLEFPPVLSEERRLFCREACWAKLLGKAGGVGDVQLGGPGVAAATGLRVCLSAAFPTVSVYYRLALGPESFQMPLQMLNFAGI